MGALLGTTVGFNEGLLLGVCDVLPVGFNVGVYEAPIVGSFDCAAVGFAVGACASVGSFDGASVGFCRQKQKNKHTTTKESKFELIANQRGTIKQTNKQTKKTGAKMEM